MIPSFEVDLMCALTPSYSFTPPNRSEIDEEGIGCFRDVWAILDVGLEEAWRVMRVEQTLLSLVSEVAETEGEFEDIICAVESGDPEAISTPGVRGRVSWPQLWTHFPDEFGAGEGLDLGVAGLTYTLAALGLVTAASCRAHCPPPSWSDCPVVFFATDRQRAEAIIDRAPVHGCGVEAAGGTRGRFLTVFSKSVVGMNSLAEALLTDAEGIGTRSIIVEDEAETEEPSFNPNQLSFGSTELWGRPC